MTWRLPVALAATALLGFRDSPADWWIVALAGLVGFALSPWRLPRIWWPIVAGSVLVVVPALWWPGYPLPFSLGAAVWVAVLAFGEEALFRGVLFEELPAPIITTTVLFAVVHINAWGWGALPIDVAAGILFGWQRRTTGSWMAPGITHAVANLASLW